MATTLCTAPSFALYHGHILISFSKQDATKRSNSSRQVVRAAPKTSKQAAEVQEYELRSVLGVSANASKREVKAAYRKLALRFHPDVCRSAPAGDQVCEQVNFTEVNRAYQSLMTSLDSSSGSHLGINQTQNGVSYGFSSHGGVQPSTVFQAADQHPPAAHAQDHEEDDDPRANFLQNLMSGTYEELREDYSSYYSNLKYYSNRSRRISSAGSSYYQYYCQGITDSLQQKG